MNERVFLGLGSNRGDRQTQIECAIQAISQLPSTTLAASASLYESEPVGVEEQPRFLNTALEIQTEIDPKGLLASLKGIEEELGRQQGARWGPREIDLDILLYGDRIIQDAQLEIPHPEMHHRRFVLVPLAEIAPELHHPRLNQTIRHLLQSLEDERGVWLFPNDPSHRSSSESLLSKKRFWSMRAPM